MSDTTTPPKKMWTRCNGCKQRIYNDALDIKIHAQHCPYDLQMSIQKLTIAVFGTHELPKGKESLAVRIESLEETIGDLDTAEPTLDPDGIDENAYTDTISTTTDDPDDLDDPDDDDLDTARADATTAYTSGLYTPAIDRTDEPPYTTAGVL